MMRTILLASTLIFVSQALFGDAPENPIYISHVVSACSEYEWVDPDDEESQLQRVCLQVSSHPGAAFSATIKRECMVGVGTCPAGPFAWILAQCYVEGEHGSDILLVANKNHFKVDIQPEDCDYTFGEPLLGAELIANTNGGHELLVSFERWESRYIAGSQQCKSILGGGTVESRSADIIATIDGQDVLVGDYIRTYKGQREYNHCSH